MTRLVDVVNFNADASCLPMQTWLDVLAGGASSTLYRWLKLYVDLRKKIVIGFPGSTIADMARFNRESIELIRDNDDIFEIILRPFAHDISLLRTGQGFRFNLDLGIRAASQEFRQVANYYLPPEFMCNSAQVTELVRRGVAGVFLYPARFGGAIAERIPRTPFRMRGLQGTSIDALPIDRAVSDAFLDGIHMFNADQWNQAVLRPAPHFIFSWRDGESAFLLPDTIEREASWLAAESDAIERCFVTDAVPDMGHGATGGDDALFSYPIHSFAAWVREMKMYWYIARTERLELALDRLDADRRHLWLQTIGSDILSAVEKEAPVIDVRLSRDDPHTHAYTIHRQPKELAGEEYLGLIDGFEDDDIQAFYRESNDPHMVLLRARMQYLAALDDGSHHE